MVFFFRNKISKGYYFWKKRQHKRFSKQKQQQEKQQLYQQWNGIVKSISRRRQDPPEIDQAYIRKGKSQVVECKVSDPKPDEARYGTHPR
ncbi:hypothetical protein C2G38_2200006 [Gigaspora rosea]|uniref:Uncharacterized protein n=1 Tax=Gigaspora rosea TaxID=44941 RepID=A0A397UYN8_9GLOM|nr:hypothetical protein C2G38_2200006 [Gigaspora rosea]